MLGLSSGPACLAACGPALLPLLVAERRTPAGSAVLLTTFLSGRLAGYLAFAALAWMTSASLPVNPRAHSLIFGAAYCGTAVILAAYAAGLRRRPHTCAGCTEGCGNPRTVRLRKHFGGFAPAILGLFTGLNLCPPFVAAAVRAAEAASLASSLLFFTLFFAGTAVWTLPAVAAGLLERFEAASFVARLTMGLMALYYGYLGALSIGWRLFHG
jgi:hypothetical protein